MPSRDDSRNDTAACPACGQLFTPAGRRRWCSDACRQAAWRRRQPRTPAEPPPPRSRNNDTIYQRPDCAQRQLGQQRCDECGIFTRRIGPGGTCPHCDELVAITDIQDLTQ